MMNFSSHPRLLCRSFIVGAIASFGLLSGIVPSLSERSPLLAFNSSAYAESVSSREVSQYARAVLLMERIRLSAYTEIKKINGSVPNIVCGEPGSLEALPGNARSIAVNYCDRSKKIITSNGLSISRFNDITRELQSNANLKTRIQNEMLRLQQASP